MDGNRRFARKNKVEVARGHSEGFQALKEILRGCLDLGIREVSVYAFSLENFKRPKTEVDALMDLAIKGFYEMIESGFLKKHGVKVNIVGDLTLFPDDVQHAAAQIMHVSEAYTEGILNVMLGYTSRQEMLGSVKTLASAVQSGALLAEDIDESLFDACLFTSSAPDVLVRTSGETRLSDFMLWQSSFSCINFLDVLWPEFTRWHMFSVVLSYQLNYERFQAQRQAHTNTLQECQQHTSDFAVDKLKQRELRIQKFLASKDQTYTEFLLCLLRKEQQPIA